MHTVTIIVDGIFRDFEVDDDGIINNDWNKVVESLFDTINSAKEI